MRPRLTNAERQALLERAADALEADTVLTGEVCPSCGTPFEEAGVGGIMYLPHGSKTAVLHLCRACTSAVASGEQDRVEAYVLLAASEARVAALDEETQPRAEA